jgi:alpha-tubulin suppressor-like RCC1 family protein
MKRAALSACLILSGCSLLAPIRDHSFDLEDAGAAADAARADAGERDSGAPDAGESCTQTCMDPTPICEASADRCVECLDASHCDDGNFCTADRCNFDDTCTSTLNEDCIAQVTVGVSHSCARFAGGNVACWGGNASGQLGVGDTDPVLRPVTLGSIHDAFDIDAGHAFTCAVRSDGSVWCWGAGSFGRLGNGAEESSSVPVRVSGIDDAVEVSLGQYHACARRIEGTIACWGSAWYGQLGDGRIGFEIEAHTPVDVMGVSDAVEIEAELDHTCVRRASGLVSCWGYNTDGDLGNGTNDHSAVPVDVDDIATADQASGHCLRIGGEVACWGRNDAGQIGDGSEVPSDVPVRLRAFGDAIDVVSSGNLACARRSGGETLCWGDNFHGQMGNGESGADAPSLSPGPVMGLSDAVYVAVGMSHVCAVRATGALVCWGNNFSRQVTDSEIETITTPTEVEGI